MEIRRGLSTNDHESHVSAEIRGNTLFKRLSVTQLRLRPCIKLHRINCFLVASLNFSLFSNKKIVCPSWCIFILPSHSRPSMTPQKYYNQPASDPKYHLCRSMENTVHQMFPVYDLSTKTIITQVPRHHAQKMSETEMRKLRWMCGNT